MRQGEAGGGVDCGRCYQLDQCVVNIAMIYSNKRIDTRLNCN